MMVEIRRLWPVPVVGFVAAGLLAACGDSSPDTSAGTEAVTPESAQGTFSSAELFAAADAVIEARGVLTSEDYFTKYPDHGYSEYMRYVEADLTEMSNRILTLQLELVELTEVQGVDPSIAQAAREYIATLEVLRSGMDQMQQKVLYYARFGPPDGMTQADMMKDAYAATSLLEDDPYGVSPPPLTNGPDAMAEKIKGLVR